MTVLYIMMVCTKCGKRWRAAFRKINDIEELLDEILRQRCPCCGAGPGDILADEMERI